MNSDKHNWYSLGQRIKTYGRSLGFQQVGITDTELSSAETYLTRWLSEGKQGDMGWMSRHGRLRTRPAELVKNTLRIISVRMDYLPPAAMDMQQILEQSDKAYISRYALGRDYHRVMRNRLQKLATMMTQEIGDFGYRVFVDSAPVMEKPLAEKAGLGWIGKHTNLLNKQSGSWFFLGEMYTDLPLPVDSAEIKHCGDCQACIDICPTKAITAPYELDARLCISYLTIEHEGAIPEQLRPLIGNRIYGCDDCQLCCPWNRFSDFTGETDFYPRHQLDNISLLELFEWDAETFLQKTEGSAIRRIGYERWQRNIATSLGNIKTDREKTKQALNRKYPEASKLVKEHIKWSLNQLENG